MFLKKDINMMNCAEKNILQILSSIMCNGSSLLTRKSQFEANILPTMTITG